MQTPVTFKTASAFAAVALVSATLALAPAPSAQAAVTYSGDLNPGDKFHLVFVTAGTTTATETSIGAYNTFVQSDAAGAGLVDYFGQTITWKAIASTASVHAKDNIGDPTASIYNTAGALVAQDEADLWSWPILAPIEYDAVGLATRADEVWSGTEADGLAIPGRTLGTAEPVHGARTLTGACWIACSARTGDDPLHMYAISTELTFVPEPTSLALLSLGGLLLTRRRRS